jgi:putative spermidine/putrescine transport system permease protein
MGLTASADTDAGMGPPVPASAPSASKLPRRRRTRRADLLGLLPFTLYVLVFLGAPTYFVVSSAFQSNSGSFTLSNFSAAIKSPFDTSFENSLELSLASAVVGAVLGLALAFAISGWRRDGWAYRAVSTASGVLAYFGGLPLAFVFLATLGPAGLATKWLTSAGWNPYDHGFVLWQMAGLVLVYIYFQIPLMVLVIFPALDGLRPQWEEAARSLGASRYQYWRRVGGPLLFPPFLGALLLLFANAFAAYATAYAIATGTIPLVPIEISTVMDGNVVSGEQNLGYAMGTWMIVIVGVVVVGYVLLQRRAARWLR